MTLSGTLVENIVRLEKQAIEELHNKGFYGRARGDRLEISLAESAYLIYREKIIVKSEGKELDFKQFFLKATQTYPNFELHYIVYKDLKERGYYVQPAVTGFRVYPRGGHPGKTPAEFFVFVTSERIPLQLSIIRAHLDTADNLKKRLVLAIVDEESDITFYEMKKTLLSGSHKLKLKKSHSIASLLEDRVMVWNTEDSLALHSEGFFGKPMDEGHLQLSLIESCYLLKNGIIRIEQRDHVLLDHGSFGRIASGIESDFMIKYEVYEKLRNIGAVPKTGFKFGTHFRVYKDFEGAAKLQHSDYLVHAIEPEHVFSLQQLSRAVRLANSVKKEMVYGVAEQEVDFVIIGRMRL